MEVSPIKFIIGLDFTSDIVLAANNLFRSQLAQVHIRVILATVIDSIVKLLLFRTMSDEAYEASLDLLRRLNPKNIARNLTSLGRLAPDLAEELLSSVDQPLGCKTCAESGKKYLICDYNRDGDSYRSPWSNTYYPELSAGDLELAPRPSAALRELEVFANDSFDIYRDLYYEGGISSVYLWNPEEDGDSADGFAGCVLLKKDSETSASYWDSIHIIDVLKASESDVFTYTVTSTIILSMDEQDLDEESFDLNLSGNLTRQIKKSLSAKDNIGHITNIGTLVEDIESKLRNLIQEVYFGKTKDVVGDLRTINKISNLEDDKQIQQDVIKGLQEL